MRINFLSPAGALSISAVEDAISLVHDMPPRTNPDEWTELERLIAWDWAMREYLRASDHAIKRRPRPSFI